MRIYTCTALCYESEIGYGEGESAAYARSECLESIPDNDWYPEPEITYLECEFKD